MLLFQIGLRASSIDAYIKRGNKGKSTAKSISKIHVLNIRVGTGKVHELNYH